MNRPDFKPAAIEFVKQHGCHTSTPVELIVEAMEMGASAALKEASEFLRTEFDKQEKFRLANNAGDSTSET